MKPTVLVVDDEPAIVELAQLYLEQEGYRVITAADGAEALAQARQAQPALMVLDLMLPQIDGWEVCKRLRAESDLPIIMLTARADDIDKIVGLELGADDYMTKPFNPRELAARVRAILRRVQTPAEAPGADSAIVLGDLRLDPAGRAASVQGEEIVLRAQEFDLLTALVQHAGKVLSRNQLLDLAWGYEFYGDTRTVDVHVAHLRGKLAGSSVSIETVWGVGYKLVA